MTKAELQMLEKVWIAEVEDRLPFQTKSKVALKLVEDQMLQPVETVMSGIKIAGYELTHAGRFYYCSTAEDEESTAPGTVI